LTADPVGHSETHCPFERYVIPRQLKQTEDLTPKLEVENVQDPQVV
jgi:hypothetical protein